MLPTTRDRSQLEGLHLQETRPHGVMHRGARWRFIAMMICIISSPSASSKCRSCFWVCFVVVDVAPASSLLLIVLLLRLSWLLHLVVVTMSSSSSSSSSALFPQCARKKNKRVSKSKHRSGPLHFVWSTCPCHFGSSQLGSSHLAQGLVSLGGPSQPSMVRGQHSKPCALVCMRKDFVAGT